MTLVLLSPIGLGPDSWERVPLPPGGGAAHSFPGFGGRPRAGEQPTMASLADEVAAGYDGDLDLVGQSLGGMVALHVALRHPQRVRSLLVACTGATSDPATMAGRAERAEAQGMEGVLEETLARWFTPDALAAEPEHPGVAHARAALLALDPHAFADGWRAIATHDVGARLREIGAPTTALAGSADSASSPQRSRAVAEGVSRGRFVELDGPHLMHLEHPRELGAAIAEHLEWAEAA